jgi:hypothetical protein
MNFLMTNDVESLRSSNMLEYVFADVIRHELKIRNLGAKAAELLKDVIRRAKDSGFEFVTVLEYRKMFKNDLKYQEMKKNR